MFSEFLQKLRSTLTADNPIWLTVYSDLMTNLMLFFLMLYGVSRMTPEVRAQILEGLETKFRIEAPSLERKAEEVMQAFQEEESAKTLEALLKDRNLAAVDIDEERLKVTLSSPALFASGSAEVSPELLEELQRLVPVLAALPNTILVEGHTDDVPVSTVRYASNWQLSVARADAVVRMLIEEGLPSSRFVTAGYGEYRPVAGNDTAEGRSRNRRIEISLLRKDRG